MYHRRPMGTLVALEGIDGSGKSTQASLLNDQLRDRGFDSVVFREPGDSVFGDKLRQQFRDGRTISAKEEARLFIEDRRIDVNENIRPALVAGKVVVMDRYYFSTMAYQGALGLNTYQLQKTNELFAPKPDLTLILDLPAETSAERIRAARGLPDSYEGTEYLRRVRELFLEFCGSDVVAVDAETEVGELSAKILRKVLAVVEGP
ncbi:MAG TPA: dTMP kinase [Acidobacteriota bacterium]|nr:dTMP kinase [Acidobacteriota bacterium]HJO30848.1 dTMP kinase [Acidobacteriota bacterium]